MASVPSRLRLVLPDPAVNLHAHAFDEVTLALAAGLTRNGIQVDVTKDCRQGADRVLVLAPHLQPLERLAALRDDAILYTWEPLHEGESFLMNPRLKDLMSRFTVWDYSEKNVAAWRAAGAERVVHVPLAYDPVLERLPGRPEIPVIDVLFYGSVTPRRQVVLQELVDAGLRVEVLFGVYGRKRDAWIAASRTVINLHSTADNSLELPRLVYLWANHVTTIVEVAPGTEDAYGMADAVLGAPYEKMVPFTKAVLAAPEEAQRITALTYQRLLTLPHASEALVAAFAGQSLTSAAR